MPDGSIAPVARQQRAYSLFTIKSVNDEQRVITGIATTPEVDRVGDIVESKGAVYKLPLPLLYQHNSDQPIGQVTQAKATADGIEITARVAKDVPVPFIEEAWQLIKAGLVRGFSIGFSPIEYSFMKDGGIHFTKVEIYEVSAVTIPANASASISTIKSIDSQQRAASGTAPRRVVTLTPLPGASGTNSTIPKGTAMATIAEQISAFESKRAATVARREAVQQKAIDAGRTKDEAEKKDFDDCTAEIDSIDSELDDLRKMEAQAMKTAKPITKTVGTDPDLSTKARDVVAQGDIRITHVQPNVEKGIAFTRYVKALIIAKGSPMGALQFAQAQKSWMDQTPQVVEVLKAAVAGGDTTTAGWAAEWVYNQNLVNEFIGVLRPKTIIGRIPGLTQVPFNVRIAGADSGTTAYWVGQGAPVPVSKMNATSTTLGIAKAAGLVVMTQELIRSSTPSAEMMVRNDLVAQIAQFLDQQFIAPDYAAVANVSPASITNGVTPTAASGTSSTNLRTDLQTLFSSWITNNLDPSGAVLVMTPTSALAISLMLNSLGNRVFPDMTMQGGTLEGIPVIVSQSAKQVGSPVSGEGNLIVLISAPDILLADDGQTVVDASAEASIQQLDNPSNNAASGTATTMVSMWQTESVAVRATRFINWAKRRSYAVQYIKDAAYVS